MLVLAIALAAVSSGRCPRARSAIGLSEDNIDSPHGDHMPRTAATAARAIARTSIVGSSGSQGVWVLVCQRTCVPSVTTRSPLLRRFRRQEVPAPPVWVCQTILPYLAWITRLPEGWTMA